EQRQQTLGDGAAGRLHAAISPECAQVLLDAEERICPSARTAEARHDREGRVEQHAGEAVLAGIGGASDDRAESPQRAAMAILGALLFAPLPRVRHEVSEASEGTVESVTDECEVARRERAQCSPIIRSGVYEKRHQQEGAGVFAAAAALFVATHDTHRV